MVEDFFDESILKRRRTRPVEEEERAEEEKTVKEEERPAEEERPPEEATPAVFFFKAEMSVLCFCYSINIC